MFSAEPFFLQFKNRGVDTGRDYSHTTARFGYNTSPGDVGQPLAVCDHSRSTTSIGSQLPRVVSRGQNLVCRPFQNRTWSA
jgi:hypothetical protein